MNELPTTAGTTNLPTTAEIEVKQPVEKPGDQQPTKTIDKQVEEDRAAEKESCGTKTS